MQQKIGLERGPLLVAGLFKTPEGDFLFDDSPHGCRWCFLENYS